MKYLLLFLLLSSCVGDFSSNEDLNVGSCYISMEDGYARITSITKISEGSRVYYKTVTGRRDDLIDFKFTRYFKKKDCSEFYIIRNNELEYTVEYLQNQVRNMQAELQELSRKVK